MFGAVLAAEPGPVADVARDFSPRVEPAGDREVTLDLHGLERLIGDARTIAAELRRTAADRGLRVRVAVAGTSLSANAPAGTYFVRVYAVGGPTGLSHASNETVIVVP